ncbi:MAG: secretin and TonB N-terminal domain-containing protein [Phycisphaerae bacterium]|nr:secretin and TonB N-terminal domain-containing protein [Phycisphaerae bacterium]NUQ45567.1 secretin and TonB N-terminal domain-containing protein [Phycisphaerae bacterium]
MSKHLVASMTALLIFAGAGGAVSADDARSETGPAVDASGAPSADLDGAVSSVDAAPTTSAPPRDPFEQLDQVMRRFGASGADEATGARSAAKSKRNATVKVNTARRVEMHVAEMPIADVLRMLSEESRRNILASKAVTGTVTANLYDATFEEALDAVLRMNNLGFVERDGFIFVHTQEELGEIRKAERRVESRVFRLKYLTAVDAKTLIAPLLTDAGKIATTPAAGKGLESGGGKSGGDGGGNDLSSEDSLVVTDDSAAIERIATALVELDVRPRQVLIEATILRATLNEDTALGIDFTTLGGVDFAEVGGTSPAAQAIVTGATPANELENTTFTVRTDVRGAVPNGGLTFGIIKNNVGVFLRALEQVADTSVIANPKVLALNKQRGEVIVGRRDGYFTTTVTETAAIQTVEFLETGTQLVFRPYILDDEHIRMEIHPKDSTGGLSAANLPFEQTTEVTTNVLLRDGHTILIGGLFREVTTATRGQVPGLGNIPIAGALFRTTNDNTVREEVIILLTVRVVKGEPEEREGALLAQQVERYRIGLRRGLQNWSRERLAQAHYRWALEHLAAGRTNRALWDAQMAVHNAPRFLPAQELIDELRRRRIWDEDASAVRLHIQRMIAADQGLQLAPFGRPTPASGGGAKTDEPAAPDGATAPQGESGDADSKGDAAPGGAS